MRDLPLGPSDEPADRLAHGGLPIHGASRGLWDGLCGLSRRCLSRQRGLDVGNRNGGPGTRPSDLRQVEADVGCTPAG
jgi:hypothetical protein